MSKSTNRYGNVRYRMTTAIDATPVPPVKIARQAAALDQAAMKAFKGTHYNDLTSKQKVEIHLQVRLAKEKPTAAKADPLEENPRCIQ